MYMYIYIYIYIYYTHMYIYIYIYTYYVYIYIYIYIHMCAAAVDGGGKRLAGRRDATEEWPREATTAEHCISAPQTSTLGGADCVST